jgi:hypothetical protein
MCSSPWEILMWSAAVSICGKVLRTAFDSTPGVKGT